MKKFERESFIKSFSLFLITLIFLNSIIFLFYFQEQKQAIHVNIFNKIKLYNYTFDDKDIFIDIVTYKNISELYVLHVEKDQIYAYFEIPTSKKNTLKIVYPYKKYQLDIAKLKNKTILYYLLSSFILLILSIMYSFYAMKPLRDALHLLEEFLKDIIHDLNTPLTSILLNLKILKKSQSAEAIKRIEFSTKNIGSLYNNLEVSIRNNPLLLKDIDIKSLVDEKIEYYSYLFPDIKFQVEIGIDTLKTSYDEISRILDNLISNACKYNKENGSVLIYIDKNEMRVEDTGIGIKNTNKVFERFYKENERGIGIGLDIVKKLCKKLGYTITIESKLNSGTKLKVTF